MQDKLFMRLPTTELLHGVTPKPAENPLGRYVLEELPADLQACVAGTMQLSALAARHHGLLAAERRRIRAAKRQAAHEAQLDMVMLLGAYLLDRDHALDVAPPLLLELLARNALRYGFAERMTYELIVDVNTEAFLRTDGNIRTFCAGAVGHVERDFYIGHYFAERHMKAAYETLRDILDNPGQPNKAARLQTVRDGIKRFTAYMTAYARLPHDEYAQFRRFLMSYPDKVKNASGAFMPSPQLLEMLLHVPAFAQTAFITDNERYFSRQANEDFRRGQAAAKAGRTLENMLHGELRVTPDEAALLHDIVEQFIQFKLTHIRVVTTKIPEAFPEKPVVDREELRNFRPLQDAHRGGAGQKQGTGGFVPQDFLGDGVRRLLELQALLAARR